MDPELLRQLREAGVPTSDVPDLARIASELIDAPRVEPDRAWLEQSRARLLERFAARLREQAPREAQPLS
jgi:hypothetical protein